MLGYSHQAKSAGRIQSSAGDKENVEEIPNDADASYEVFNFDAYSSKLEAPWVSKTLYSAWLVGEHRLFWLALLSYL